MVSAIEGLAQGTNPQTWDNPVCSVRGRVKGPSDGSAGKAMLCLHQAGQHQWPSTKRPGAGPKFGPVGRRCCLQDGCPNGTAFWGLLPGEPVSRCCPLVLSTSTTPVYPTVSTSIRELLGGCQTLVVPQKDRRTSLSK